MSQKMSTEIQKVLVISPTRLGQTRRERMSGQLNAHQGPLPQWKFTPGVDNLSAIIDEYSHLFGHEIDFGLGPTSWDAGAQAVAISHVRAWSEVLEIDGWCLVLEDDAILKPRVNLQQFELPTKECDFLTLFTAGISRYEVCAKPNFGVVVPNAGNYGCVGYIISPQGIDRLQSTIFPLKHPIDIAIYNAESSAAVPKTFCFLHHFISHDEETPSLRKSVSTSNGL